VTVVRTQGSTPQRAGAKMLVHADGRTIGTIGGGCYENEAVLKAREAIGTGRQALLHYELNDDFAQENGLICGGRMDVHVDPLDPAPTLYVIGAGHVGWHVARVAADAGFRLVVVDDRVKFANADRFPGAEVIVEADPRLAPPRRHPPSAYVAVLTRGHQHDLDAVRVLASRDLRYLGLIGSRAKVVRIREALIAEGCPPSASTQSTRRSASTSAPSPRRNRRQHRGRDDRHPARRRRRPPVPAPRTHPVINTEARRHGGARRSAAGSSPTNWSGPRRGAGSDRWAGGLTSYSAHGRHSLLRVSVSPCRFS
jgi:xanthine dehydrogenase accessory factor